jgi:hypothetical protein
LAIPGAAALGHTRCGGGEPVVRIRPGLPPAESALVAAHEEIHVRQARHMGCEAWEVMMGTGEGRLELEAEAYCADLLAIAPRPGADRDRGVRGVRPRSGGALEIPGSNLRSRVATLPFR